MVIVLLKYGVGSNDSESKYYEELHCTCFKINDGCFLRLNIGHDF